MTRVLTWALRLLRCLSVMLAIGVFRCASRGRRLELSTNSAQLLDIADQILEEDEPVNQAVVQTQECEPAPTWFC